MRFAGINMTKKIQFDGASLGNPGVMGIGVVLFDGNKIIDTISEKLPGIGTNNRAEYTALLKGIKHAKKLGWKRIFIEGDSKLIVNQVNGIFAVRKPPLKQLHREIMQQLSEFDFYELKWIPRELNSVADSLSKKAVIPKKELPEKANASDIKCPKCDSFCSLRWQTFKNKTRHIRMECPTHGFISYVPKNESNVRIADR